MANETKTGTIVRSHFVNFGDIIIEEQSSDDPKINKLLKMASKKGLGKGRPDFFIKFNKESGFLIVMECKADKLKHESKNRDQYADYAVDGVLLYASYLSKEFDVLAIAVSGEQPENLRVSHFLHLKRENKSHPIFGEKLLSPEDYVNGYLKSPEKFRQDYDNLLEFTQKLNKKLHTYRLSEIKFPKSLKNSQKS